MTENCEYYTDGTAYTFGKIVLCRRNETQCPYRNSKKMGSWEAETIFRCLSNGKVERLVKEDTPKQ